MLGEGGMGVVYDAVAPDGARVALKMLSGEMSRRPDVRRRFEDEARILREFVHPSVVRSFGAESIDGRLVLALEYLEGETLRARLEVEPRLPPLRAVTIARAIADALAAAHGRPRPIVHRDVKPENVMLLPDGTLRVMDFGVAKVLADVDAASFATKLIGTVRYISPEQAVGAGVTTKCDLYALGVVLYEMLAGRVPFDAASTMAILRLHADAPPPAFDDALRATLPRGLEGLVFALLDKKPTARPDARATRDALDAVLSSPAPTVVAAPLAEAAPTTTNETLARIDRATGPRWPWIAIGIAGALGVAGAITCAILIATTEPDRAPTSKRASAPATSSASPPFVPPPPRPGVRTCIGTCAAFAPPDPRAVDPELVIERATAFVVRVDPSARLQSATFESVRHGQVDLTVGRAPATVAFTAAEASYTVAVSSDTLETSPVALVSTTVLGPHCPFDQALKAAVAAGLPTASPDRAYIGMDREEARWTFEALGNDFVVSIAGTSCRVANVRRPRARP